MVVHQGGQSPDLPDLFCTGIRTEPVGKLVIISLILNECSCRQVLIPRPFMLQNVIFQSYPQQRLGNFKIVLEAIRKTTKNCAKCLR